MSDETKLFSGVKCEVPSEAGHYWAVPKSEAEWCVVRVFMSGNHGELRMEVPGVDGWLSLAEVKIWGPQIQDLNSIEAFDFRRTEK